jgi:hypothetical protein
MVTIPGNWDTSVGIITGYRLVRGQFLAEQNFSLLHSMQANSGAHLVFCPVGVGGTFPSGKVDGT